MESLMSSNRFGKLTNGKETKEDVNTERKWKVNQQNFGVSYIK